MFSHDEILARLRERPFRPFRIIASEGLRFTVRHPELVLPLRRELFIGQTANEDSDVAERAIRVAMVHIVALEEPEASATVPPPAEDNGRA